VLALEWTSRLGYIADRSNSILWDSTCVPTLLQARSRLAPLQLPPITHAQVVPDLRPTRFEISKLPQQSEALPPPSTMNPAKLSHRSLKLHLQSIIFCHTVESYACYTAHSFDLNIIAYLDCIPYKLVENQNTACASNPTQVLPWQSVNTNWSA
jgi:hypothetical protein